jgi:hypothetical protein
LLKGLARKTKVPGRKTNEGYCSVVLNDLQECGHRTGNSQMLGFGRVIVVRRAGGRNQKCKLFRPYNMKM